MKFNGLKYNADEHSWDILFGKKIPTSLVKFYANSEYAQQAVMQHYLFLSHVSHLNDAYEASEYLLDFSKLDKQTYERWYRNNLSGQEIYPYEKDKANNFSMFRQLYKSVMAWIGSVSFTTRDNIVNTLMWSHYATDKGFVIDFKTDKLIEIINEKDKFDGFIFPVNYVKKLRPINPTDERYGGMRGALLYLISTKIWNWKYEKEWRLTCYPKDGRFEIPEMMMTERISGIERKLEYQKKCVGAIILGEQFFNTRNVDCETLRKNNHHLRYKLKQDQKFVEFIYENFNDRLFMSGPWERKGKVLRSIQQIHLEKEADDIYIIHPLPPTPPMKE